MRVVRSNGVERETDNPGEVGLPRRVLLPDQRQWKADGGGEGGGRLTMVNVAAGVDGNGFNDDGKIGGCQCRA